jgi:hypothetical protein
MRLMLPVFVVMMTLLLGVIFLGCSFVVCGFARGKGKTSEDQREAEKKHEAQFAHIYAPP